MKKSLGYKILRDTMGYFRDIIARTLYFINGIPEIFKERYFERKLNISTGEPYFVKDRFGLYKIDQSYCPAPYHLLEKIIDYLKLKPEDIFIDLGCGKGRVVFFVAQKKLRKVIGVELNKKFIDIANKNLATFTFDRTAIQFVNEDAAKFRIKDENIFFMFNPFGCKTIRSVIDNIKNSLIDNPRQIRIVYLHPWCRSLLDDQNWLILKKSMFEGQGLIWHNKFLE